MSIQDENDLQRHFNYIHYNPVKYGSVQQVKDWQWSSFHRFVRTGWYDAEWDGGNERLTQLQVKRKAKEMVRCQRTELGSVTCLTLFSPSAR